MYPVRKGYILTTALRCLSIKMYIEQQVRSSVQYKSCVSQTFL